MNAIVIRLASSLLGNPFFRVMMIAICADMIFGSLRAGREHKWNSAVGIDGGIRKVGMICATIVLHITDMLIHANVIALIPMDMQTTLAQVNLTKLGIAELFALLFILYEATSVLKNMLLCGLPIPRGVRKRLESWLQNMTDETNVNFSAGETQPE